mmetsp:Transcript_4537/g.12402  ORF Transcript_4537/g.12402 Transcript_4537/m.12402 type:complete len:278 (+) Transcript_4537:252-1085(+)
MTRLSFDTKHHANLATWVSRDGCVGVRHAASLEHTCTHASQGLDDVQVQPNALCLGAHDTSWPHSPMKGLKERLFEQNLSWAHWIRAINNDGVIAALLSIAHKFNAITDVNLAPRVVEADCHLWEILLAYFWNHAIDLCHVDLLNGLVPRHLTQDAAITSTHNQYLFCRRLQCAKWEVGDHLLVRELITLSCLDDTIQQQDVAECCRSEHTDVLELGSSGEKDLLDFQRHAHSRPHGTEFGKPAILDSLNFSLCHGPSGSVAFGTKSGGLAFKRVFG